MSGELSSCLILDKRYLDAKHRPVPKIGIRQMEKIYDTLRICLKLIF